MDEFTRALQTAFGAGPAGSAELTVDRLDGRAVTGSGGSRLCATAAGFGGNDPVRPSVSPCRLEHPAPECMCQAEPPVFSTRCICRVEHPAPVAAIHG
ncbi:hypothetical protein [Amycolatopsis sp. NPDC098790]|uniref:hypothetical protein n=1 Tax=Amycolatopsis sp. NPDC098790 TaxID=3363939 RepID=UPI003820A0E4